MERKISFLLETEEKSDRIVGVILEKGESLIWE